MCRVNIDGVHAGDDLVTVALEYQWVEKSALIEVKAVDLGPGGTDERVAGGEVVVN